MKLTAYKCDLCNTLQEEENIHGLNYSPDMFDVYNSFKPSSKADKTNSHYCAACFINNVVTPCEGLSINPKTGKKDPEKYDILLKDYKYAFYKRVFSVNNLGVI